MTAWLDKAVFCAVDDAGESALESIVKLGYNAVRVSARNTGADEILNAARGRDLSVAIGIDGTLDAPAVESWVARGANGFFASHVTARAIVAVDAHDACVVADGACAPLFGSAGEPHYFDGRGSGDFGAFWSAFRAQSATARIALVTSDDSMRGLSVGRETEDLEAIFAFLLTWPCVPVIRFGDERGVEPLLERLIYLRLTEAELAGSVALQVVSDVSPGYPLVYRRGNAILVAINAAAVSHRVALPDVGDARPIAARHCHLAHSDGRWCARLAPAAYGVFNVT